MIRLASRFIVAFALVALARESLPQQRGALIQGVVLDATSGAPIAKAAVELQTVAINGQAVASTRTDREGKFYLPNTTPGSFRIRATHAGHVAAEYPDTLAGQRSADVRVAMTAAGVISGRITDKGKPIGLADAVALKAVWTEGQLSLTPVIAVRTDDTGEFHLFWLPPGRYYVIGVVWDFANSVGFYTNVDGDDSDSFFAQRFVGRAVFMRATGGGILDTEAHVPIYYPGTHEPQMARAIDVQPGATIRGIDIDASAVRVQSVSGRVYGLAPQATARVDMNLVTASLNTSAAMAPSVQTDSSGNFELKAVAPGRYMLTATTGDAIVRTPVEVRNSAVNGIALSLGPRLSVSGKVSIEGAALPNVLSSLRVNVRQDPLRPNAAGTGIVPVRPDGTFTITSPPAGDFRVLVPPLLAPPSEQGAANLPPALQNLYVKSIRMGDKEVLREKFHLAGVQQEQLTILLGTGTGSIDGQAAPGATVVLVHDDGLRYRVNEKVAIGNSSGRFEFRNVAPGNYKLFAWNRIERGAWNDPDYMRGFESRGVPLRIEEGGKVTITVPVIER
jgi:hypothetical protein